MRISDWSSDVCSSDLRVEVSLLPHRLAAARQAGEHFDFLQVRQLLRRHRAVAVVEGDRQRQVLQRVLLRRHRHRRAVGDAGDDEHAGIAAQAYARSEVGVRSEEHTSELQSLMRISYAVFCLKKKTKKKQ